jgi:hypothetical protein
MLINAAASGDSPKRRRMNDDHARRYDREQYGVDHFEREHVGRECREGPPDHGQQRGIARRKMRCSGSAGNVQPVVTVPRRQGFGEHDIHGVIVKDANRQRVDDREPDRQRDDPREKRGGAALARTFRRRNRHASTP